MNTAAAEKAIWLQSFNNLSSMLWWKFKKSSNKFRSLTTQQLILMHKSLDEGKSVGEAHEEALMVENQK